jgi:hypothetical protein
MDSQSPGDRALRTSWIDRAQRQEKAQATQNMQQPNFAGLREVGHFKDRFNAAETGMRTKFDKFDDDMQQSREHRRSNISASGIINDISEGKQQAADEKERIEIDHTRIKQKERERADKGAFISAWNKFWE